MVNDSSYLATWNQFFCSQHCRSQIVQVEYQGQTRNSRTLELKPLIDTSHRIRHILELKYFTSHNFCSMLIKQLINLEKVKTENLKFRTDLHGWSVTQ